MRAVEGVLIVQIFEYNVQVKKPLDWQEIPNTKRNPLDRDRVPDIGAGHRYRNEIWIQTHRGLRATTLCAVCIASSLVE